MWNQPSITRRYGLHAPGVERAPIEDNANRFEKETLNHRSAFSEKILRLCQLPPKEKYGNVGPEILHEMAHPILRDEYGKKKDPPVEKIVA